MQKKTISDIALERIKKRDGFINEITSTSDQTGYFVPPVQFGYYDFEDIHLGPFSIPVSPYESPELDHDSYDGKMSKSKKEIQKIEKKAKRSAKDFKKNHEGISIGENYIKEMTTSNGAGPYSMPLSPGTKLWKKSELGGFTKPVSKYDDAELAYDSYDGKLDVSKRKASQMEKNAIRISKYKKSHPNLSDDDGDIINPIGKSIKEASSVDGGLYNGPIELGLKKWKQSEVAPFSKFVKNKANKDKIKKGLKNNIEREVGKWEKGINGTYEIDTHPVHTIKEDLAVWFGKKKKPKGSSQPKGPWVNICRKVNGKHPPCGRPEASDTSYPKCRAAGVAGKMSDSQKRAACAQKRRAEKTHSKSGTGNTPKMVSYKPRKKINEMVERIISLLKN